MHEVLFAEVAEKGGRGLGEQEAWTSGRSAGFRRPWKQPNRDSEEATSDRGLGTTRIENGNVVLVSRWKLRPCLWLRQRTAQDSPKNPDGGGAWQGGLRSRGTDRRRPEPQEEGPRGSQSEGRCPWRGLSHAPRVRLAVQG